MKVFSLLRAARDLERRELGFLETVEDLDLVREIGFHEERGAPLTMNRAYAIGVASAATVQRRLRRLRELGAVVPRRSRADGRVVELTLGPAVAKTYARYVEMIRLEK